MSDIPNYEITSADLQRVQDSIGEEPEILSIVNIKKKKNKYFTKAIALTKFRIILLSKTKKAVKGKIQNSHHLYEIKEMKITDENHFSLITESEITYEMISVDAEDICRTILSNFLDISQGFSEDRYIKFESDPSDRLGTIPMPDHPGGGVIEQYLAWCDFFNIKKSQQLIDYIQKEILEGETPKSLNLSRLRELHQGLPESVDVRPLFNSLRYNCYFNELVIVNVENKNLIKIFEKCLETNSFLNRVILSRTFNDGGLELIGQAIGKNKNLPINFMDLSISNGSKSQFEALCKGIGMMNSSLRQLDLSHCNSKGLTTLFDNLGDHVDLQYLNLSYNSLGKQGTESLTRWVDEADRLIMLDLSHTDLDIGIAVASLKRHPSIQYLNISHNTVSKRGLPELPKIISSEQIKELDVSYCSIDSDTIISILEAIFDQEEDVAGFKVNFSGNELGKNGAVKLKELIYEYRDTEVLYELILDDCKLGGDGIASLCGIDGFLSLESLKVLSLSRNVKKSKKEQRKAKVASELFNHPGLKLLRIRGDDKHKISLDFEKLSENKNMVTLDLSFNSIGPEKLKELYNNIQESNIEYLIIDQNNATQSSLQELAWLFKQHNSLKHVEWPKYDVGKILAKISKRDRSAVKSKIKELKKTVKDGLERNNGELSEIERIQLGEHNDSTGFIIPPIDSMELEENDVLQKHLIQMKQKLRFNLDKITYSKVLRPEKSIFMIKKSDLPKRFVGDKTSTSATDDDSTLEDSTDETSSTDEEDTSSSN